MNFVHFHQSRDFFILFSNNAPVAFDDSFKWNWNDVILVPWYCLVLKEVSCKKVPQKTFWNIWRCCAIHSHCFFFIVCRIEKGRESLQNEPLTRRPLTAVLSKTITAKRPKQPVGWRICAMSERLETGAAVYRVGFLRMISCDHYVEVLHDASQSRLNPV